MKVGNLRVFSDICCGGVFKPTIGPLWYFSWIPMIGCYGMLGGVLIYMTIFTPMSAPLQYSAIGLIVFESLLYWSLCFSQPGIPPQILRRAR